MNTKTKIKTLGWMIPITTIGITFLVGSLMVVTIQTEQFNQAKEKTLIEIENMNVSDDYKQGWVDALNRMDDWYHTAINMTAKATEIRTAGMTYTQLINLTKNLSLAYRELSMAYVKCCQNGTMYETD